MCHSPEGAAGSSATNDGRSEGGKVADHLNRSQHSYAPRSSSDGPFRRAEEDHYHSPIIKVGSINCTYICVCVLLFLLSLPPHFLDSTVPVTSSAQAKHRPYIYDPRLVALPKQSRMAPGLVETTPTPPHELQTPVTKNSLFPDGLRTSGQHNPVYSRLRSFEDFPKEISGPTVWKMEDFCDNPERWTHPFSQEEIAELGTAADKFIAAGTPLTGISKVRTMPTGQAPP